MLPPAIKKLTEVARKSKATDIHICVGAPVLMRVGRDLLPCSQGLVTPELSERLVFDMLTPQQKEQFLRESDYDMMVHDPGGRYRVNICMNDGFVGAVIRVLPQSPRSLDQLGLPNIVKVLSAQTKGMILITGSTSQGKTSTLSGMIDEVNTNHRRHVVTIEDPIENVHINKKGVVRQRQVGRDTQSFSRGLRAALRQDPDVIAIGEMRDYESIKIALTAAETGVLVISTLHVISIDKMVERLLSYAPEEDIRHIRYMLADALQGVIHQELIPALDGSKRVGCEVLVAVDAVRNIIRRGESFMLRNVIQSGGKHGMVSMRQSVGQLLERGEISAEMAERVLSNY
jgi:twitching motility protein PilT